jgi:GNAT superfamily N-acetyltransferase
MTSSPRRSIETTAYSNPCGDNGKIWPRGTLSEFYTNEEKARAEPGNKDPLRGPGFFAPGGAEWLQREYPNCLTTSPAIDEWHKKISTWIPRDTEDWWMDKFENNEHLDSMSREWWRLRTRNLVVAHERGRENNPLGVVALTLVHQLERFETLRTEERFEGVMENYAPSPIFYEIRGLVVDESSRGEGIGLKLVQAALYQAIKSQMRIPTLAITTNAAAGRIFDKTQPPELYVPLDKYPLAAGKADSYDRLACWSRFEDIPASSNCSACPIKNKTSWWWPTHCFEDVEDRPSRGGLYIFRPPSDDPYYKFIDQVKEQDPYEFYAFERNEPIRLSQQSPYYSDSGLTSKLKKAGQYVMKKWDQYD